MPDPQAQTTDPKAQPGPGKTDPAKVKAAVDNVSQVSGRAGQTLGAIANLADGDVTKAKIALESEAPARTNNTEGDKEVQKDRDAVLKDLDRGDNAAAIADAKKLFAAQYAQDAVTREYSAMTQAHDPKAAGAVLDNVRNFVAGATGDKAAGDKAGDQLNTSVEANTKVIGDAAPTASFGQKLSLIKDAKAAKADFEALGATLGGAVDGVIKPMETPPVAKPPGQGQGIQ